MAETIESLFDQYARLYSEGDLHGIVNLCLTPFIAIRRGEVIVMSDRDDVLTHFTAAIDAYRRATGARSWSPQEITTVPLGDYSALATVHWNGLDANGQVVRDTVTSYQLVTTPDGWRFLSYTNHF